MLVATADACVVCRDAFPCEQQFSIVSKYIVDQSQATNFKVSQATNHFACLSVLLCFCLFSFVSVCYAVHLIVMCGKVCRNP